MAKEKNNGVISFVDYRVLKTDFILNTDFEESGEPIDIEFDLGHNNEIIDDQMYVTLALKLFENSKEKNYPFEMNIVMEGIFIREDETVNFKEFLPNAMAIMFPYIRAMISTITANSNVTSLILPTINIVQYLKEND